MMPRVLRLLLLVASMLIAHEAHAGVFKCEATDGTISYQQTPCPLSSRESIPAIHDSALGSPPMETPVPRTVNEDRVSSGSQRETAPTLSDLPVDSIESGDGEIYLRCEAPGGRTYIARDHCRSRPVPWTEQRSRIVDQSTGIPITDAVRTGPNSAFDPRTGQTMVLTGAEPMRRDSGTRTTKADACDDARNAARAELTDRNRTIDSIRRAEAHVADVCD